MTIHDYEADLLLYAEDSSSGIKWTLENFIGMIYVIMKDGINAFKKKERASE